MPAFNCFLFQFLLTNASLNPLGHPSSSSQTLIPCGQHVHQALAGVAALTCSHISSSNTKNTLFKAMQSLWAGHWIRYNEGEQGWCVLVWEEGRVVPWPQGRFLLRVEDAGLGCHGQRGKQGRERLPLPEGQKAHSWVPKMHILALSASRGWTKVPVFLENRPVS